MPTIITKIPPPREEPPAGAAPRSEVIRTSWRRMALRVLAALGILASILLSVYVGVLLARTPESGGQECGHGARETSPAAVDFGRKAGNHDDGWWRVPESERLSELEQ